MPYGRKYKRRPQGMAQKQRRKTNYRKKKFTRRRNKGLTSVRVKRNQIVPDRYFTKLKYQFRQVSVPLNSTTALNASVVVRGNSLFDPEYSSGGGQPIGFDHLKTLYHYYRVHASKVKTRIYNNTSTSAGAVLYQTIYPSVLASVPPTSNTNWADVAGQPHARYKFIKTGSASPSYDCTMSHKMKSKTVFGTRSIMNTDHQTSIQANPTENTGSAPRAWYYVVTIWNADQSTATVTYDLDIEVEYYCEFLRPVTMIDSTLYGDPDGSNDVPQSFSGTYMFYSPSFGGSGSNSNWIAGPS